MSVIDNIEIMDSLIKGDYHELKEVLLKKGLDINCNIANTDELPVWTPLHYSAYACNLELFRCIIDDPDFSPSPKALGEVFSHICHTTKNKTLPDEHVSFNSATKLNMFRDLIYHPKVEIEKIFDFWDRTVLFHVVFNNKINFLKELICAGKVCNQTKTCHFHLKSDNKNKLVFLTPEVIAKKMGHSEIAGLLRDLRRCPLSTTQRIRLELKNAEAISANIFCCVVLLCDGYFRVAQRPERINKGVSSSSTKMRKFSRRLKRQTSGDRIRSFFDIATKLPIELQMMLCNRSAGLAKDIIVTNNSEMGFVHLFNN